MTPALVAALLLVPAPAPAAKTRLVSIVWDGAADWVVDRLLAEGALPNVARLKAQGVSAESVIPAWPSKTAVGHASLFTGCWPDRHGIANNGVGLLPRLDRTLDESGSGFDGRNLLAEPVWVSAAASGRKVVALSAACSFPPEPFVAQIRAAGGNPANFVEFSGFETELAAGKMIGLPEGSRTAPIMFPAEVAGTTFSIAVLDESSDPVQGLDTVVVSKGPESSRLKPLAANDRAEGWSIPFKIVKNGHPANVYFRLWALAPDGTKMELYQRKVSAMRGTEGPEETAKYVEAYGGFHDDPFFPYGRGLYGKPIYQGGDGEAERRLIELVKQDCDFLTKGFAYAWKRWKPDMLLHYTPMSDSAGHQWVGALDPDAPGYDEGMAQKLWPFYRRVYELQDQWLGPILDSVGKDTVVALMSDHGMAGARKTVYLNNALQTAGLLGRTESGQIDWSKTKAAVPPWSDFFVCVNSIDRKGGVVFPHDRKAIVDAVERALLGLKDPETGAPIVTAVFRPEDAAGMGLGGPTGGDLYFELAPGYYPSSRTNANLVGAMGQEIGGGVHGFYPYRRKMGAIFYAAGPGFAKGGGLPVIRHIDVFPTLFRAAGIPMPKGAAGTAY